MKYKRWALRLTAAVGAAALWWGAYNALTPLDPQLPPPQPLWVLKDDGGRLARYEYGAKQGPPVQTYPVYTALLPQPDLERLHSGIPVYSDEELRRLIEDFGG